MTRCLSLLGLALALAPTAVAAPPTLTSLFPAGAQRGQAVEVTAAGTFGRWPAQVWCDRRDVEIKPGKEKGKLAITVAADAVPGVCWLRLADEQGASAQRPFLIGTLPEVNEQEPNDDFKKPHMLAAARATINGRLEKAGDVDCFAVALRKGQTLAAALEANHTLGSPLDGVLQVLSADGFVLQENNDYHGLDPQIIFPVPKDGTYVVRTFAFPAVPDASVRLAGGEGYIYRLTLTTAGFADHAWPLAVANANPGSVELVGWNIPDAARQHDLPREAADSAVVFHPDVAHAVAVRREPHSVAVQAKDNDRQHPQAITLPVTISGQLERRDVAHAYQFDARKGQKLLFQFEAHGLGFPLEPVLRLSDGAGKVLAQAERAPQARDPELSFTIPQDGSYRIEVSDLHGSGSPRHRYRLRAVFAAPEFDLTLPADRFTMLPGKPLDIPVAIVRRHGFERAVELSVEGLPPGVTAATVQTGPAASAKSVTLRLTGDAMPALGFLRILGKPTGTDEPPRLATALIDGLAQSTTHLWLTIPKPAGTPVKP